MHTVVDVHRSSAFTSAVLNARTPNKPDFQAPRPSMRRRRYPPYVDLLVELNITRRNHISGVSEVAAAPRSQVNHHRESRGSNPSNLASESRFNLSLQRLPWTERTNSSVSRGRMHARITCRTREERAGNQSIAHRPALQGGSVLDEVSPDDDGALCRPLDALQGTVGTPATVGSGFSVSSTTIGGRRRRHHVVVDTTGETPGRRCL